MSKITARSVMTEYGIPPHRQEQVLQLHNEEQQEEETNGEATEINN